MIPACAGPTRRPASRRARSERRPARPETATPRVQSGLCTLLWIHPRGHMVLALPAPSPPLLLLRRATHCGGPGSSTPRAYCRRAHCCTYAVRCWQVPQCHSAVLRWAALMSLFFAVGPSPRRHGARSLGAWSWPSQPRRHAAALAWQRLDRPPPPGMRLPSTLPSPTLAFLGAFQGAACGSGTTPSPAPDNGMSDSGLLTTIYRIG